MKKVYDIEDKNSFSFYKLEDKKVVKCSLKEYAEFMSKNQTRIKQTDCGDVLISTIFLGIDTNFNVTCPLVFETMVFGGKWNQKRWRDKTYEDAMKKHEEVCELVKRNE